MTTTQVNIDVKISRIGAQGELKAWARIVEAFNPDLVGGFALVGAQRLNPIKRWEGHRSSVELKFVSTGIEVGKVIAVGLELRIEGFTRRFCLAAKVSQDDNEAEYNSDMGGGGCKIGIAGNLSLEQSVVESSAGFPSERNAFYEIGKRLVAFGWLHTDDSITVVPSEAIPDDSDTEDLAARYIASQSLRGAIKNPNYDNGKPMQFRPQKSINDNGKRITLPDGFHFFHELSGIWLICTVGDMQDKIGKKIGLVDMLLEADVQLTKPQVEFIEQQARLLEGRAQTYRMLVLAKSNRKES